MSIFKIDPDIRRAWTLASDFYTDPAFFEESKQQIFARCWQLVGLETHINNVLPCSILDGFLSEPILFTRDDNKQLHCLSNVCTHRGKIVVENCFQCDGLRCGYHGRRFSLDGEFLSMPEFENAENFPCETDNLTRIPFESWEKMLFASIDPVAPFAEFAAEIKSAALGLDFGALELKATKEYLINAHWALYCENYLEGFHIPFVHKSLNEVLDYGNYTTDLFRYSSLQTGFDERGEIAARYFFVFPNLMFNFYPWGLSVNIVKPIDQDFTKVEYLIFVADKTKIEEGAGADLETVELEDQAVVESVQKGINSSFYDRGRYSPKREQGTHHFHQLISEFMNFDK